MLYYMYNIYIYIMYIRRSLYKLYTGKKTYSPGEKDQGRLQCDAHGGAHRQTWDVILKGHWDTY